MNDHDPTRAPSPLEAECMDAGLYAPLKEIRLNGLYDDTPPRRYTPDSNYSKLLPETFNRRAVTQYARRLAEGVRDRSGPAALAVIGSTAWAEWVDPATTSAEVPADHRPERDPRWGELVSVQLLEDGRGLIERYQAVKVAYLKCERPSCRKEFVVVRGISQSARWASYCDDDCRKAKDRERKRV